MLFNQKKIELLKRSSPHLDLKMQQTIGVILKINDLHDTINDFKDNYLLSTCDTSTAKICTDDILRSIRPACSKKEKEIIDTIINATKAIEMCNMYKLISDSKNDSSTNNFDNLNLTPEQQSMLNNLELLMHNSQEQNS